MEWHVRYPSEDIFGVTYGQNFRSKPTDTKLTVHCIPSAGIGFYILSIAMWAQYQAEEKRRYIIYVNGLVQDCSNSSDLAMELLQSLR